MCLHQGEGVFGGVRNGHLIEPRVLAEPPRERVGEAAVVVDHERPQARASSRWRDDSSLTHRRTWLGGSAGVVDPSRA